MQQPDKGLLALDAEAEGNPSGAPRAVRPRYDVLDDPDVMIRESGTYDTYRCLDCNVVLSGYKRGDPGREEHLWRGNGQCRYFQFKYADRKEELIVALGRLRFQKGFLAFPQYIFHAIDGYVTIAETQRCVVCACPAHRHDFRNACEETVRRLVVILKHLTLEVPVRTDRLFNNASIRYPNFAVLGESANMYHLTGTADTYKCAACELEIKDFVVDDTLLGEHIYQVYNRNINCSYIADRFGNRKDELAVILGKARYRKGLVAFEAIVTKAECGYTVINGQRRCVVCGALIVHGRHLKIAGHHPHCEEMKQSCIEKLYNMRLLL